MSQLEYVTASLTVRPPRALLLVPGGDRWQARVRTSIEWFSQTWGGNGNALLPVVDGRVPEIFRPLVRAFDPDWLCLWPWALRDERDSDPDAWLQRLQTMATSMRLSTDQVEAQLETMGVLDQSEGWSEGEAALEEVLQWCAPHRVHGSQFVFPFAHNARTSKPLCDLSDLEDLSTQSLQLSVWLDCDDWAPDDLRLGIDARYGRFSPAAKTRLRDVRINAIELHGESNDLQGLAESLVVGRSLSHWSLHTRWQAVHGVAATAEPPTSFSGADLLNCCPMSLTSHGMTEGVQNGSWPPPVVVVGDDSNAFFVSMLLDRMLGSSTWVSSASLEAEVGKHIVNAAAKALRPSSRQPYIRELLVVDDFDPGGANEFASRVKSENVHLQSNAVHLTSMMALPLSATRTLIDPTLNREIAVPTHTDSDLGLVAAIPLEVPLPSQARGRSDDSLTWQVDVMFPGRAVPARSFLSTEFLTVDLPPVTDMRVRSGQRGLVVESHDLGFSIAGWGLPQMLARPRLRTPSTDELFAKLHESSGFTLRQSPAGALTVGLVNLWPNLEAAAADLHGNVRRLLMDFISKQEPKTHGLRYLDAANCATILDVAAEDARSTIDRLCRARLLHRGFLLKCGRCTWRDFYRLGILSDAGFECSRCHAETAITRAVWIGEDEPAWFYDLDQVARAALESNCHLTVITLDLLRASTKHSFGWMTSSELWHPGASKATAEVDVWALMDGRVAIGEVKKGDYLSRGRTQAAERNQVANYLKAVRRVDADVLVLATACDKWSAATESAMQQARIQGLDVMVITQVSGDKPITGGISEPV